MSAEGFSMALCCAQGKLATEIIPTAFRMHST
jgi:hypothetical protein